MSHLLEAVVQVHGEVLDPATGQAGVKVQGQSLQGHLTEEFWAGWF